VSIVIPGLRVTQGTLPFESATSRMARRPFGESRLTVGAPMTMLHAWAVQRHSRGANRRPAPQSGLATPGGR